MDYLITDFGARTCDALQTKEIQNAIDACFLSGGGRVVIPAGVFRTGGIRLRSNVTLYLKAGAILEGSFAPEDYMAHLADEIEPIPQVAAEYKDTFRDPCSRWNNGLIKAIHAENIAVIGEPGSYLDGVNCYDCQGEEDYRGPHMIHFFYCKNITLNGYTIRRSANWAHNIAFSQNITVRNVTVYGGHDGFDIFSCDHVNVKDCTFITGDDCIAGFDNQDIRISDCYLESACSLFRFGGTNVLIERCRSKAPASFGHRGTMQPSEQQQRIETNAQSRHNTGNVFLYYCDHRLDMRTVPGNIVFRDCEFEGPDALFQMDFGEHMCWCCNRPLTGIRFERCKCQDLCAPSLIKGDAAQPIVFELEDMEMSARESCQNIAIAELYNYELFSMKNVSFSSFTDPRVILRSQGNLELDNQIRTVWDEEGYRYTVT